MKFRPHHPQHIAAAKAGFSERTARRMEQIGGLIIDPIAGARVRARRKWPVSGESGRVHDPIATRPKHDLQRDR